MNPRELDPEQLAALLDGRLGGREREEVLARLAASPEAYEAYLDAVALLDEGEARAPEPARGEAVVPIRRPFLQSPRRWLALAAAVLLLVGGPLLWSRWTAPAHDAGRHALLLADASQGPPAGWDASPWPATRGAGSPLSARGRAVRLGARLTDLELAVAAGDSAGVAAAAGDAVALLDPVTGAGPAARHYRGIATVPAGRAATDDALARGRAAVAQLPDDSLVQAGEWLQAARVAAARRDTLFFRRGDAGRMLRSMAAMPGVPAAAREQLELARRALPADGPPSWSGLELALTSALASLGG